MKARPQGFNFSLKKLDLVSPFFPTFQVHRFILTLPHCIFLERRRTDLGCRKPLLEDSESYGQSNALKSRHCAVITCITDRFLGICPIIKSPNKTLCLTCGQNFCLEKKFTILFSFKKSLLQIHYYHHYCNISM